MFKLTDLISISATIENIITEVHKLKDKDPVAPVTKRFSLGISISNPFMSGK